MYSKYKFIIVLHLGLLLCLDFAYCQKKLTFKGTVVDSINGNEMEGANVTVISYHRDSIFQINKTDKYGAFSFSMNIKSNFYVRFSFVGYKTRELFVDALNNDTFFNIKLTPQVDTLEMIDILHPSKQKHNIIEYQASNFDFNDYDDVDVMISQIPGLHIDDKKNITFSGDKINRILVDGKPFFSSDPQILLKLLPAYIVKNIQIINSEEENPYIIGHKEVVLGRDININTKDDMHQGIFGAIQIAEGTNNTKYWGGNANFFNENQRVAIFYNQNNISKIGQSQNSFAELFSTIYMSPEEISEGLSSFNKAGINVNLLNNNILDFNFEYIFNKEDKLTKNARQRKYTYHNQPIDKSISNSKEILQTYYHQFAISTEYRLNNKNFISLKPVIKFSKNKSDSHSQYKTIDFNDDFVSFSTNNRFLSDNILLNGFIAYRYDFNLIGRTINISISKENSSDNAIQSNIFTNELNSIDSIISNPEFDQKNLNRQLSDGITYMLIYREPLNKVSNLQFAVTSRNFNSKSQLDVSDFDSSRMSYIADTLLSSNFETNFNNNTYGLAYTYGKDNINYRINIDLQTLKQRNLEQVPNIISSITSHRSLLPSISISNQVSKKSLIQVNYNTTVNPPNPKQLQETIDISNPMNIYVGNSLLKKETSHRFKLEYRNMNLENNHAFTATLALDLFKNKIINSSEILNRDSILNNDVVIRKGGRFVQPINIKGYLLTYYELGYTRLILNKKLSLNYNIRLENSKGIEFIDGQEISTKNSNLNSFISLKNSSSLFDVTLEYYYGLNLVKNNFAGIDQKYLVSRHLANGILSYRIGNGVFFNSTLRYLNNSSISGIPAQNSLIWNASAGLRFLKRKDAEITLSLFDIFNNNSKQQLTYSNAFIESNITNAVGRFFLIGVTYNFKKFGL